MSIWSVTLVAWALCSAPARPGEVAALVNGDFEGGDLSGWTVFTTSNGTLGGGGFPMVLDFDSSGDGSASKSAGFKVGQQVFKGMNSNPEGGGISQAVALESGRLTLSADIASSYSSQRHRRNLSAGVFELVVDDIVLASHDFGPIAAGTTARKSLSGSTEVAAGVHEIRVRITRPAVSRAGTPAPFQFIDNVVLKVAPPEP